MYKKHKGKRVDIMNGITMMIIAIVVLGGAYLLYGRYLQNKWGIDPKAKTPAYEMEDGVDYVPADTNVVFGHQFASIAGAGPINGPIQAAIFGWLPVLLWILIGGVFFGAVQDFASMYASVKNKGRTIGYIIEAYIGKLGKKLFLLFCWLFCILVVAAFADVVAGTFNGFAVNDAGTVTKVAANGAVATTSMLFIFEAVALGFFLKYTKFNKWVNTAVAILLLVAAIVLGLNFPMYVSLGTWHIIIFVYILIASVAPVWALLQPRDYLNSYLLIFMIVGAVIGVFVANPSCNLKAFTSFNVDGQYMFPILFVTIACGAVSGFHSLVSSGTASKQIKSLMPDQKLENLLNLAMNALPQERAKSENLNVGYDPTTRLWDVIVKYSGPESGLGGERIQVVPLLGSYAVVTLPETEISAYSVREQIEFIEKPKRLYFETFEEREASCILPVQNGADGLTGKGILVGIVDSGVDYFHPDFRNEDGSTRILRLWDQSVAGNPPKGYVSGTEYTKEEIDEALALGETEGRRLVPSGDFSGHGTAVLGIAAGNGRASEGVKRGVAYRSDLLVVKMGNPRENSFPRTTELMEGIDYLIRQAVKMRKPIVINVSFGNNYGSHRGDSLLYNYRYFAGEERYLLYAG